MMARFATRVQHSLEMRAAWAAAGKIANSEIVGKVTGAVCGAAGAASGAVVRAANGDKDNVHQNWTLEELRDPGNSQMLRAVKNGVSRNNRIFLANESEVDKFSTEKINNLFTAHPNVQFLVFKAMEQRETEVIEFITVIPRIACIYRGSTPRRLREAALSRTVAWINEINVRALN
eukprot:TRINITY_DN13483_c4_g1_i1.p1 TRINITY_DN13483_c4_g1~~TRINITY_DN13483_c4_g1_i1.p1  ORF type:complete len:176 (+),score=21.80 TRINITY_DN13483_c4_g1_i1:59-586(+)